MTLERSAIYDLLKKIPKGKVTTYGSIAKKLNSKSYQGIGKIIALNPNAPEVPCHRVVKANGEISGYAFGVEKKIKLLELEGVEILDGKIKNFKEKLFTY